MKKLFVVLFSLLLLPILALSSSDYTVFSNNTRGPIKIRSFGGPQGNSLPNGYTLQPYDSYYLQLNENSYSEYIEITGDEGGVLYIRSIYPNHIATINEVSFNAHTFSYGGTMSMGTSKILDTLAAKKTIVIDNREEAIDTPRVLWTIRMTVAIPK